MRKPYFIVNLLYFYHFQVEFQVRKLLKLSIFDKKLCYCLQERYLKISGSEKETDQKQRHDKVNQQKCKGFFHKIHFISIKSAL